MRKFWILSAVFALNSCVVSNIGGTIRSRAEQHFTVDRGRPDVVYLNEKTQRRRMLAPEVTYQGSLSGLVYDNLTNASWMGEPEVTDTGRQLWVEDDGWTHSSSYELSAAPDDAWKQVSRKNAFTPHWRTTLPHETKQVGDRTLRTILAAPFDYLIDPALTLTYTGLFYCGELIWLPFFTVYTMVSSASYSEKQIEPVEWGQL